MQTTTMHPRGLRSAILPCVNFQPDADPKPVMGLADRDPQFTPFHIPSPPPV